MSKGSVINDIYLDKNINGINIDSSIPCHSSNFTKRSNRNVKYIVIHYTGNKKDKAINNAKYFQEANIKASAHFFVDDTSIYQSVALKDNAYHCGAKKYKHKECRNSNSIGIEMCCTDGNYRVSKQTQINSAYLCAYLCNRIGITYETVDTYVLTHEMVTGKACPKQYVDNPSEFVEFKERVKEILRVHYSKTQTTMIKADNTVPTKIKQNGKDIQKFLNEYYGEEIKSVTGNKLVVDGILGSKSKKAIAIAFQVELNKLGAKLEIGSYFVESSSKAFDRYIGTLKLNSKGIFVTLWQCLLVTNGLDPKGIDGIFGKGCITATNLLFEKYKIDKDSQVSGSDINKLI